jgi:hypothetical protein
MVVVAEPIVVGGVATAPVAVAALVGAPAVAVDLYVLLAEDVPVPGPGFAASTIDGFKGDGLWWVAYGATTGVSHGMEVGVYGAPITTPADTVTKAAVAMAALADNASPPNHDRKPSLLAAIILVKLVQTAFAVPGERALERRARNAPANQLNTCEHPPTRNSRGDDRGASVP